MSILDTLLDANVEIPYSCMEGICGSCQLNVTEGIPDALTAAASGYQAAGILGSHAPDERLANQLALHAASHHQRIIAISDRDRGGHVWGQHLAQLLTDTGTHVTLIEPADGNDLNDWARQDPDWADGLTPILAQPDRTSDLGIATTP